MIEVPEIFSESKIHICINKTLTIILWHNMAEIEKNICFSIYKAAA